MELQKQIRNTYTVIFTDAQYTLYTPVSRKLSKLYNAKMKTKWKGHHTSPDCFLVEGMFFTVISPQIDKPATKTAVTRALKLLHKQLLLLGISEILIDIQNPLLKSLSQNEIKDLIRSIFCEGIRYTFI